MADFLSFELNPGFEFADSRDRIDVQEFGELPPPPALVINVAPFVLTSMSPGASWSCTILGEAPEILAWASYGDLNVVEMIYDGVDFCPNFKPLSTLTQTAFLPNPESRNMFVRRSNGWPGDPKIFIRVRTNQGGINA